MNQIRCFIVGFISICLISCQQSAKETTTEEIQTDSISVVAPDTLTETDTTDTAESPDPAESPATDSAVFKIREGAHYLSLQWISWDRLGKVQIKYLGNNTYSIVGEQRNPDNSDYLKINGTLEPVSAKKLIFEGTIESQIAHLNQGQPCLKEGIKIFESTKNRKYWRMQDMENCEGGMVVDYVDIYF